MDNTENQPPNTKRAKAKCIGYNIDFEPKNPPIPAPKCVKNYATKPPLSQAELCEKQDLASKRRKEGEEARLGRIQLTEENIKKLDGKVRPFINALSLTEGQQAASK